MRFVKIVSWTASAVVMAGILLAEDSQAARKKRLAVLDFEYGTVRSEVSQMFGSDLDVGRGMAALLVKHLVRDGTYTVLEPRLVQMSLIQQGPSGEWRNNLVEAARVGRMLGVDALVVGTILQFGAPHQSVGGGGGGATRGGGGGGFAGKESRKAVVALNARVVDIESGEVVTVVDATGQSMRSSKSFAGFGMGSGGFGFGGVDFTTSGFLQTIIGEATDASILQLSRDLIAANGKVGARRKGVNGLVAHVKGSAAVLNVGTKAGVRTGDVLVVERVTEVIRDPATGEVIRRITSKLGEVRVTQADEVSSECEVMGGVEVKVGDVVRRSGS
ncbi:MAG: CsgG/HfaB family protein [Bryobacteraceae bacterium]